jgi:hypothetical protein
VMVVGLTSSLQVKWCSDNRSFEAGNKMQTARCQSQTLWKMVQIFKTKLQVCCTVCTWGWALSCRTATLLRLVAFPSDGLFQEFQCDTVHVTISYTLMFQDDHQHPKSQQKVASTLRADDVIWQKRHHWSQLTTFIIYIWGFWWHVLAEIGYRQVIHISEHGVPFKFFLLGELECFHFMVNHLLVGVKWSIHFSTPLTAWHIQLFPSTV